MPAVADDQMQDSSDDDEGWDPTLAGGEPEFDSVEEVEAVARSLRRVAIEYALVILFLLVTVPILSLLAPWWYQRPIWGGVTLNFLTVAAGLHIVFLVVALAYARVANRGEDDMLGRPERNEEGWDV